jgi:hypothetical protein
MTPVVEDLQSISLKPTGRVPPANTRLPPPTVTGKVQMCIRVNEIVFKQGLDQIAAAMHPHVRSVHSLELLDLVGDVACDENGVLPGELRRRVRHDVLFGRIERFGDGLILVGVLRQAQQAQPSLSHSVAPSRPTVG